MKSADNPKAIAQQIHSILDQQVQCVLATQAQGQLCQHLMAYAFSDTLATIYMASFETTAKVRNIAANPNVSLLWDNRTGNNKDHKQGFALSAQGAAEVLDTASASIRQQLLDRNDSLKNLLDQDQSVLIAIHIDSYQLAIGYTQTYTYRPA